MFGIFGLLFGGVAYSISNTNQKYAEVQAREKMRSLGYKYYTDSHGVMREVETNNPVSEYDVVPRPQKKRTMVWKVVKSDDCSRAVCDALPAVQYFSNSRDAFDYIKLIEKTPFLHYQVGTEWK